MKFIDASHSYINQEGEKYTSVTSLIKQYEPKKDWDTIAAKYAKKHKKDVNEVKQAWKDESEKGLKRGNEFHARMEAEYVNRGVINIEGKDYKVIQSPLENGIKLAIPLKLEDGIYPEVVIYSDKYKVAGQADLVEILDGKINIKDYKTNKEIKLESYQDWKGNRERLNHPLSGLMSCNFITYSLQINIYMCLLKAHNPKLKIGIMELLHIQDDEIIPYKVPNMQKDAKRLLEYHYETLKYSF